MNTLASFPDLVRRCLVHPTDDPTVGHIEVYAPCCRRRTAADSILDVRDVPGTVVAGGGLYAPRDHDWLCDGCRWRLYHDAGNAWTRSMLYSAVGAHPDDVRVMYARELAGQVEYWDHRLPPNEDGTPHGHRPADVLDAILAALPQGVDPHRSAR